MIQAVKDEFMSWIKPVVFGVLVGFFINNVVIVNANVPTGSMENNIMIDDRVVAFRLAYLSEQPERFDVVMFKFPDDESEIYVKRVIGLPGETVEIKDGKVYINGADEPLDDSFIKNEAYGDHGPYTVPGDHYFMLGDNRNISADSRYWENKYVSGEKIFGRVIFRYYPSFRLYENN